MIFDANALYASFVRTLPDALCAAAKELPRRLGFVPADHLSWAEAFKHDVTLGAPALFAEALPNRDDGRIEQATLAHLLAVIHTFGTDRILDGQATDSDELRALLEHVRQARNDALRALGGEGAVALAVAADAHTERAIRVERRVFERQRSVRSAIYEMVSAEKQTVGLPATVALFEAAGDRSGVAELARATLLNVALGLQYQDDVADWESDLERGGAWAVLLANRGWDRKAVRFATTKERVLSSGVLAHLLALSERAYDSAERSATNLSAHAIAKWAAERKREARRHLELEVASPGYFLRMKRLAPWAAEVLR